MTKKLVERDFEVEARIEMNVTADIRATSIEEAHEAFQRGRFEFNPNAGELVNWKMTGRLKAV